MEYPLEYVNLAYNANPIMSKWPKDVLAYVERNKKELTQLLKKEELRKLTFKNLEIREKMADLNKGKARPTN